MHVECSWSGKKGKQSLFFLFSIQIPIMGASLHGDRFAVGVLTFPYFTFSFPFPAPMPRAQVGDKISPGELMRTAGAHYTNARATTFRTQDEFLVVEAQREPLVSEP
jgi:hypothetical protein